MHVPYSESRMSDQQIHPFLLDHLVEPRSHRPLSIDDHALVAEGGERYEIFSGIPIMLDADTRNQQYVEHYQTDAEVFDYFEEREDPATAHDERRLQEAILRRLDPRARTVLDVGCGRAWVARTLCPRGVTVCSVDVSLTNPKRALENYPLPTHCALVADAFALPFADGSIDTIIASEIIEHVPDPRAFVHELMRVIKPGGSLILSTPYKEKIKFCLCIHCNRRTPLHAHIHSFDENVLKGLTPTGSDVICTWESFGNKVLLFLRTYPFLQWMPHWLWRGVDSLANAVVNKRSHIVVQWQRR
ncbi:MAG: class I SAM-dependent methyltransferase [Candidatus Kapabacteria bacterium]|nr:class I SAM-dependent methyltransferase [Candidatus Kapabacteria bacterium]